MIIEAKIVPNARKNNLIDLGQNKYKIYITAPAIQGKANQALIEFLANHFQISKNQARILKGMKSKNKIIEIKK